MSVFWDESGTANSARDTHFRHFERLKDELLPGLDRALSALILDLESRGMLDDTLVMVLTEHGHTENQRHRPRCRARALVADILQFVGRRRNRTGTVVGSSDRIGGFVKDRPVSPKDILCTLYHVMGIDHPP